MDPLLTGGPDQTHITQEDLSAIFNFVHSRPGCWRVEFVKTVAGAHWIELSHKMGMRSLLNRCQIEREGSKWYVEVAEAIDYEFPSLDAILHSLDVNGIAGVASSPLAKRIYWADEDAGDGSEATKEAQAA